MHKRRGLRYVVLSMLTRSPKNGAEVMDSIEEMSQGWWRPSPGSVYPLLEDLQEEGLIHKREDGKYELTEKSKEEMEWSPWAAGRKPQSVEGMLSEMNGYVSYFEDLSRSPSDRSKVGAHTEAIRKIRDRLDALVRGGGGERE